MTPKRLDSFRARKTLRVGNRGYVMFSLEALQTAGFNMTRLPCSLKVFLENLLRNEDGRFVTADDIRAVAGWSPTKRPEREVMFMPSRVLMQDFTGVPAVVDLAAMRHAIQRLGGDPAKINPLLPVDLVVDHSVQVDQFGTPNAVRLNVQREFERNQERYAFLRWAQRAFRNYRVVPPGTGIVHQVNLEYLAQVVCTASANGEWVAFPDTLIGTDSHTTMINGLGVLGWGVGGIEAEAAMLGQPLSMLIPEVVGVKFSGALPEGVTATDVVLTVTELLRKKNVVGKFVEFYGPGLSALSLADRATIANMAPEYGATVSFFPVDDQTFRYLEMTGRPQGLIELVETYTKAQGLFRTDAAPDPVYSDRVELDLGSVQPCLAGPKRPQDQVPLKDSKRMWRQALVTMLEKETQRLDPEEVRNWVNEGGANAQAQQVVAAPPLQTLRRTVTIQREKNTFQLSNGSVVIAAITSCANTSNPSVMIGAGLLAKKAVERGLTAKPWVKTSLAPGSKVVMDYLKATGLLPYLERLGFYLVGFGCTTCIGNSGPLPADIADEVSQHKLVVAAVLSGNRNFEGRINPFVKASYLASPPLVVAYALAGHMDVDLYRDPLGNDPAGRPVFLRDLWPSPQEIHATIQQGVTKEMFVAQYRDVFTGDERWQPLAVPEGDLFAWDDRSTYIKQPPYFDRVTREVLPLHDITGARVLIVVGDSVTTDHISPAGGIPQTYPAGEYLKEHGVVPSDFNSYGARRGNHEVMMRGTFANIRLQNLLVPEEEHGGRTLYLPSRERLWIFEAAKRYRDEKTPLIVLAGKEYGAGSSRDWAAKGPALLGVKAVIAETYERIHRSNLVGMGVLPLQFLSGETRETLGVTGFEVYDITGIVNKLQPLKRLTVSAKRPDGTTKTFQVTARVDTAVEIEYYRHGGILPYVLRQLLGT